jgi:hypothetical protein
MEYILSGCSFPFEAKHAEASILYLLENEKPGNVPG